MYCVLEVTWKLAAQWQGQNSVINKHVSKELFFLIQKKENENFLRQDAMEKVLSGIRIFTTAEKKGKLQNYWFNGTDSSNHLKGGRC